MLVSYYNQHPHPIYALLLPTSLVMGGASNPTPTPAPSLPAKLPLGRQSTQRCAPTKPFGRGKAATKQTGTDAKETDLANAKFETKTCLFACRM